jgi:hypothetical protein
MKWPWKRKARAEAEQSQEAAVRVRAEVIMPLRQLAAEIDDMRMVDALPDAVRQMMARQYKEGPGDPGGSNPNRD